MKTSILALLVTTSTVSGDRRELATKFLSSLPSSSNKLSNSNSLKCGLNGRSWLRKLKRSEREARLTLPKEIPDWVVPVIVASFAVGFGTGMVVATAL